MLPRSDEGITWTHCDSRAGLEARLAGMSGKVFEMLTTKDANTWGYVNLGDACIPLGYANLGLTPQVSVWDSLIIVGISQIVACYDSTTGRILYRYDMPTVFHEFVVFGENYYLIRDEIGFVGLSYAGAEVWSASCGDIIRGLSTIRKTDCGTDHGGTDVRIHDSLTLI